MFSKPEIIGVDSYRYFTEPAAPVHSRVVFVVIGSTHINPAAVAFVDECEDPFPLGLGHHAHERQAVIRFIGGDELKTGLTVAEVIHKLTHASQPSAEIDESNTKENKDAV